MNKNEKNRLKELSNLLKTLPADKDCNLLYAEGIDELINHDDEKTPIAIAILIFLHIFAVIGILCCARHLFF